MYILDKRDYKLFDIEKLNKYKDEGYIEFSDYYNIYLVKKEEIERIYIYSMATSSHEVDYCHLVLFTNDRCNSMRLSPMLSKNSKFFQNVSQILIEIDREAVIKYLKNKKLKDSNFYKHIFLIFEKYLTDSEKLYLEL